MSLISYFTEGRKLSWPQHTVDYQRGQLKVAYSDSGRDERRTPDLSVTTTSVVVKDFRFEEKHKDLMLEDKDKDKDLWS